MQYDIEKYVNNFFKDDSKRSQDGRYASFDYCFNYFQDFKAKGTTNNIANNKNLEKSCLHLGFYLASWGMYRGSSNLLQHSCHFLKKPLEVIAEYDKRIWEIDVDTYDNAKIILDCAEKIRKSLKNDRTGHEASDTLVTKIMLGVFGNVPSYDTYFLIAMRNDIGGTLNMESLEKVGGFYKDNKNVIDRLSKDIKTIDFLSDEEAKLNYTKLNYTKAKIIDMYGFMKGLEIGENNKPKNNKPKNNN